MQAFLDKYAAPEWRTAHHLWSVQLTVFWSIMQGIYIFMPALQGYLSLLHFLEICVGMSVLIGVARLTNQPGLS